MHSRLARMAALCLLLSLSACGGGSNEPAPTPTPSPPAPSPTDRIEPFDPALLAKARAVPTAPTPAPSVPVSATVILPALPATRSMAAAAPGTPLQIGQGRALDATASAAQTAALLQWQAGDGDTRLAALRFVATEAQGLRLGVRATSLPDGARLMFHGAQGAATVVESAELRERAQRNLDTGADEATAHLYWSPEIEGDQLTLTLEIPAHADTKAIRLAVPLLSQVTMGADQAQSLAKAGAGTCEVDVACRPDAIEQGRSVARLRFVASDGWAYQCSGTLMNDAASSGTPYLLTAHHCISDQIAASSLITDWLLRSAACGSSAIAAGHAQRTGGAVLLYTNEASDATLVRLNDAPPPGVVYAGSYFGADARPGITVTNVHHPGGDAQQVSTGIIAAYSICTGDRCFPASRNQGTYFSVRWQEGVSELGSSGAGAFMGIGSRRYLVGQLFGGTSSCAQPNGVDYVSRFDLNYANALHRWLSPANAAGR